MWNRFKRVIEKDAILRAHLDVAHQQLGSSDRNVRALDRKIQEVVSDGKVLPTAIKFA